MTAKSWIVVGMAVLGMTGCAAPLLLAVPGLVIAGGGIFKAVQLTSGGSVLVASDVSKIQPPQKERFRQLKKIAVWPDGTAAAVTFADQLNGRNGIQVITPAQVNAVLQGQKLTSNLSQLTRQETVTTMNAVGRGTGAQAVIYAKAGGGSTNSNFFSLERANVTRTYNIVVHGVGDAEPLLTFPATIKVEVGGTSTSESELIEALTKDVSTTLLAL